MDHPIKEEPESPPDLEALLAEAKVDKLEAQLKEWGIDLEKFKARVEQASAEARAAYERQAPNLHAKMDEAQAKLREMQEAGADATYEMLEGVDSAWSELKKAFDSAAAKLK